MIIKFEVSFLVDFNFSTGPLKNPGYSLNGSRKLFEVVLGSVTIDPNLNLNLT